MVKCGGGEKMNKNFMIRMICFFVSCNMLFLPFSLVATAQDIMPCYNNVEYVETRATISSSGEMTITNIVRGEDGFFTRAVITTYVEKRILGIFWSRVDIGQTNDEWIDTIYTNVYSGTHSVQLPSTGTYRVTVEYVIYGSGGSPDTITQEVKKTY